MRFVSLIKHVLIILYKTLSTPFVYQNRQLKTLLYNLSPWMHLQLSKISPISLYPNEITILHKSNDYLIINKHYDLVINSDGKYKNSVEKQLSRRLPSLVNPKLTFGFHFIHRLDYATSGILCIALNKRAAACAVNSFTRRLCHKYYLAIVRGHLSKDNLVVNIGIGRDHRPNHTHKMCTEDRSYCLPPIKTSKTKFVVLQRGLFDGYPATKLLVKPITGRRHQIRVHCSHVGHTIVGDYTYSNRKDSLVERMFLHAFRLVVPNEMENLDVATADPFVEGRCEWVVVERVNELDGNVFGLFDGEFGTEISA